MRGSRGKCDLPAAAKPPRVNRLSRSFRLSQAAPVSGPSPLWNPGSSPVPALVPVPATGPPLAQTASPKTHQPEFKTPTRAPRSKPAAIFSEESPHNDSDFQHDIIWDATSPSPRRLGKRSKKHTTGVVNISEIVSRIAPKHGRPLVAEPTLQQWIGDSAAIPCTPDVQAPRAKKKSPRVSGVDDLLQLAKQFDLNLFQQDEDEAEVEHQRSPELLQEHIVDLENSFQSDFSSSLPGGCQPAASTAVGKDPDQQLEDDLDFLFDGPTQHVNGNLSQVTSAQPSPFKAPVTSTKVCGKPSTPSCGPTSGSNNVFEDDWENDDLLNDSLVFEMTQNPQGFIIPKLCSTQKAASLVSGGETAAPVIQRARVDPLSGSGVQKENVKPRATFRLNSNSDVCDRRINMDLRKHRQDVSRPPGGQQSISAAKSGPRTAKPEPVRSQWDHRTSLGISKSATKPGQSFPKNPCMVSSRRDAANFLEDDLDSLFSLDPVWDDPADDDLLCEMCEDLENQNQSWSSISSEQAPPSANQRVTLQPTHRIWDNQPQTLATPPPGRGAGSSLDAAAKSSQQLFRLTQTKPASGSVFRTQTSNSQSAVAPSPLQRTDTKHFSFKKPSYLVSMATNNAAGKCSAAEIELKKQQAMERRRQRLQAAQNPVGTS